MYRRTGRCGGGSEDVTVFTVALPEKGCIPLIARYAGSWHWSPRMDRSRAQRMITPCTFSLRRRTARTETSGRAAPAHRPGGRRTWGYALGAAVLPPMFTHVPLATYFHSVGSLLTFAPCPAHACFAVPQSF